jgi:hypothetical protein
MIYNNVLCVIVFFLLVLLFYKGVFLDGVLVTCVLVASVCGPQFYMQ